MPRYLVERSFPQGLAMPINEGGAKTCQLDRITEVRVLDPYFHH